MCRRQKMNLSELPKYCNPLQRDKTELNRVLTQKKKIRELLPTSEQLTRLNITLAKLSIEEWNFEEKSIVENFLFAYNILTKIADKDDNIKQLLEAFSDLKKLPELEYEKTQNPYNSPAIQNEINRLIQPYISEMQALISDVKGAIQ